MTFIDVTYFQGLFDKLMGFYTTNPVAAGIISLYGLGLTTLLFRDIPSRIWSFFTDQMTTTLTINSQDNVYYETLRWLSRNKLHSFVRHLNLNNSKWGRDDKGSLTIGYGNMYFMFKGRLFKFNRSEITANNTEYTKERVNITLFGRSHNTFKQLINAVQASSKDQSKYTRIYTWRSDCWELTTSKFKRDLSTVVLDKTVKNAVVDHLDRFLSDQEQKWYVSNGVPYKTGILLSGPPGTGKTSLVKAICAKYEKDLYMLSLNGMTDRVLQSALTSVEEGSIVVIEDIDGFGLNLKRRSSSKVDEEKSSSFLTMSGILNSIDGVMSAEKIILIATTNHPKKLDKALLREGRFDLKVNVGFMTADSFREYFGRFYPDFQLPKKLKIRPKLAPSRLQKIIFDNRNDPKAALKEALK